MGELCHLICSPIVVAVIPVSCFAFWFDVPSILTQIKFCIREWSTGSFKQSKFTEHENWERYEVQLQNLKEWEKLNPVIIKNICKKSHNSVQWVYDQSGGLNWQWLCPSRSTGAGPVEGPEVRLSEAAKACVKKELEGRTGETDSKAK